MKSSTSESIRNPYFNLEWFSRSSRLAQLGILTVEWLWIGFDSDAELLMYRAKCKNYNNVFCKQFDQNEHFSPFEFSLAGIEISIWIHPIF